jgi:hypothetical protein
MSFSCILYYFLFLLLLFMRVSACIPIPHTYFCLLKPKISYKVLQPLVIFSPYNTFFVIKISPPVFHDDIRFTGENKPGIVFDVFKSREFREKQTLIYLPYQLKCLTKAKYRRLRVHVFIGHCSAATSLSHSLMSSRKP